MVKPSQFSLGTPQYEVNTYKASRLNKRLNWTAFWQVKEESLQEVLCPTLSQLCAYEEMCGGYVCLDLFHGECLTKIDRKKSALWNTIAWCTNSSSCLCSLLLGQHNWFISPCHHQPSYTSTGRTLTLSQMVNESCTLLGTLNYSENSVYRRADQGLDISKQMCLSSWWSCLPRSFYHQLSPLLMAQVSLESFQKAAWCQNL